MQDIIDMVFEHGINTAKETFGLPMSAINKIMYGTPALYDYVEKAKELRNKKLSDKLQEKAALMIDKIDDDKLENAGVRDIAIATGVFLDKSKTITQDSNSKIQPVFIMGVGSKVTKEANGKLIVEVNETKNDDNVIDVPGETYSEVDDDITNDV